MTIFSNLTEARRAEEVKRFCKVDKNWNLDTPMYLCICL